MQKQNGFTFAEVLITLVVLGTVFAYTIPSVIYDYNYRDVATNYQKAINNLNHSYSAYFNSPPTDKSSGQAYKFAKTHYGSNGEILDENGNAESDTNPVIKYDWVDDGNRYSIGESEKLDNVYRILDKIVVKHMPVVNIRSISSNKVNYLTIATDTKTLYDTTTMAACTSETTPIEYFYTTDGMRYCISYEHIANNETFGEDTYGVIWVDTNGEKSPNEAYKNINAEGKPLYTGDTLPITILKDRFVPGHPTKTDFNSAAQALFFNKNG